MAPFWAMGIISGTSPHPKDVPFMREFWWGTYGLAAVSPQKKRQISAIAAVDVLLSYDVQINKLMLAWHAVRHCISK